MIGFPSSCPYVTAIGATQVNPGSNVTDPEGACEQVIFSGGGFSNYFAMPEYQKKAVGNYLKNYKPSYPGDIWNSTGVVSSIDFTSKRLIGRIFPEPRVPGYLGEWVSFIMYTACASPKSRY